MPYIVGKRIKMQGFIVSDFMDMREQFYADMGRWVREGKVKWEETVENGDRERAEGVSQSVHRRQHGQDAGQTRLR